MNKAVIKELQRWLATNNFKSLLVSEGINSFYKNLCISSSDLGATYAEDQKQTEDSDWALKIILSYNLDVQNPKFAEVYLKICFETAKMEDSIIQPKMSDNSVFLCSKFIPVFKQGDTKPSDAIDRISDGLSSLLKKTFTILSSMANVAGHHALTGV